MKTIWFSLFLGLALLVGCQSADTNKKSDNNKSGMSNPAHVAILFSKPEKPFVEIGTVSTLKNQPQPGATWQDTLQRQAGAKGADAILIDTSMLNNSNTPMVSGTAIRYQ
jgi:hypothetical protein